MFFRRTYEHNQRHKPLLSNTDTTDLVCFKCWLLYLAADTDGYRYFASVSVDFALEPGLGLLAGPGWLPITRAANAQMNIPWHALGH